SRASAGSSPGVENLRLAAALPLDRETLLNLNRSRPGAAARREHHRVAVRGRVHGRLHVQLTAGVITGRGGDRGRFHWGPTQHHPRDEAHEPKDRSPHAFSPAGPVPLIPASASRKSVPPEAAWPVLPATHDSMA